MRRHQESVLAKNEGGNESMSELEQREREREREGDLKAGSHGVPRPKSQVPLMLASPNPKVKSQLLSLKKPLKYN